MAWPTSRESEANPNSISLGIVRHTRMFINALPARSLSAMLFLTLCSLLMGERGIDSGALRSRLQSRFPRLEDG
jgi:hypothetical protein